MAVVLISCADFSIMFDDINLMLFLKLFYKVPSNYGTIINRKGIINLLETEFIMIHSNLHLDFF